MVCWVNSAQVSLGSNMRSHKKSSLAKVKRSSKHAPQELTSKRPVSRRREVLPTNFKRPTRDPRFDSLSGGGPADEARVRKSYAFLDEYRDKELADLRAQLKKTKKDTPQAEDLKKQIMRMEWRRNARQKKDEEERLLNEHKQKEKELVAQGKKPFYLKKSEQKQLALVERFQNMKSKDRDRAIERRRKKATAKERKNMPSERRGV